MLKGEKKTRWAFLDQHAGVSLVGDQIVPLSRASVIRGEFYEPCPWKGRGKGFTYRKTATVTFALGEGEPEFFLLCAFVEALGPILVLGRDFVAEYAVWVERRNGRAFRMHFCGLPYYCEPVKMAYLSAK